MKRRQVTVIGSHEENRFMSEAYEIGRHIARRNWILVCGGRGGIMEAASRGASAEGGIVVGILPGVDFNDANPYLTAAIASGIGFARNSMNVLSGDVVVAIGGRTGTMSELSYAFQWQADDHLLFCGRMERRFRGPCPSGGRSFPDSHGCHTDRGH